MAFCRVVRRLLSTAPHGQSTPPLPHSKSSPPLLTTNQLWLLDRVMADQAEHQQEMNALKETRLRFSRDISASQISYRSRMNDSLKEIAGITWRMCIVAGSFGAMAIFLLTARKIGGKSEETASTQATQE